MTIPRFQPEEILRILIELEVEFVIIGGVAGTLYGSNLRTGDLDICPRRTPVNLNRLAEALARMEPRVRADGVPGGIPFSPDGPFLEGVELLNLTTRFGDFDLSFRPIGTEGFEELWPNRVAFELDDIVVPVASLSDIIRSKEAAGRPKDREQLPTLRALLATRRAVETADGTDN
jgi:hypothetical protein